MTQWSDLTNEQRAVLRCWGPNKSEMDRDYPRPMAEEARVMKELTALGLFRFETINDPIDGPCESVSMTPAGIALVYAAANANGAEAANRSASAPAPLEGEDVKT